MAVIPLPSPLTPATIRVAPTAPAVTFAFVPAEQYARFLFTVPRRVEQLPGHRA